MAYTAKHRFARISPSKARLMADMVRGRQADEALDILRYQPQRGARMLEKVIRSALANAEDLRAAHLDRLKLVEVRVDQAPMSRRLKPKARGRATVLKKRTSHIIVALE